MLVKANFLGLAGNGVGFPVDVGVVVGARAGADFDLGAGGALATPANFAPVDGLAKVEDVG